MPGIEKYMLYELAIAPGLSMGKKEKPGDLFRYFLVLLSRVLMFYAAQYPWRKSIRNDVPAR
ncbi:MAG: hypothetical protein BGO69_01430 [Bacteroidetes bacterium 46-16]|nr:MAG: hypothetical protein BGO69_01430 [Bacteroidetes bacterium 46-16]